VLNVIHICISKLRGEVFGKKCEKCQSALDKLHALLYTIIVAGTSHIKWISGFIFAQLLINAWCVL
jgi:hypothetical protein